METGFVEKKREASSKLGHNFWLLSFHTGLSRTATSAFSVAIVWIALKLTASPVAAGFADGFVSLPLFFSFVFGAYIDTLHSRRNLAIISAMARTLSMLLLVFAFLDSVFYVRLAAIYSVAFLLGMTSDILNSIRAAWSKEFLEEDQYKRGSSLIESVTALAQAGGYAFSGVMLTLGDYYTTYAIAGMFAIALIPLLRLREHDKVHPQAVSSGDLKSSMREGFHFIFSNKFLRAAIVLILFINLAFGATGILFAYMVSDVFKLSAIYYGLLFVMLMVGIIFGSVFASKIRGKIGFYNTIFIFILGALLITIPFIRIIYPDYAIAASMGVLIGMVNVLSETGALKVIKQEMMARAMGAISTFALTITFLSGGIGGALIGIFSMKLAFVIIGTTIAIVALLSTRFREYYNISV